MTILASKAELYLFALEQFKIQVQTLSTSFLLEVLQKHARFLKEGEESPYTDQDAYSFNFQPSSVLLRTSILRLARRVCLHVDF